MKNIFKLFRFIRPNKGLLFTTFALSAALSALSVAIPWIFRNIINEITKVVGSNAGIDSITRSIILLIIVLGLNRIGQFLIEKINNTNRIKMITTARIKIFKKILELSVEYAQRHRPGSILQRVQQGVGDFFQWLYELTVWASEVIFRTLFILVVLYFAVPWVGLGFTLVIPIMAIITIQGLKKSHKNREQAQKYYEKQAGFLTETVSNLSTVKSMSSEKETISIFQNYQNTIIKNRLKQFKFDRWYNFFRDSVGDLAIIAGVAYVAFMAIQGKLSPGDIFLIAFYARDIISSVQPLSRFFNSTADVEVTSERLIKIIEAKPTIVDIEGAKKLEKIESIEFKNVSFEYPDSSKGAIFNISFKICAGKSVALVGPSGVGKTTITKLLLRFHEPTSGKILINNQDIDSYTQESVRNCMAIVMQDVALFNTTIKENLVISNPKASEQQIQKATVLSNSDEFIRTLPKGFATLVGERGIKLSGGQKQRIAIARAILKDPDFIILDEATSALDSQSEKLVQEAVNKLLYHKMSLIIAHRLSTVRHVDEIIVLKKGRVHERGSHASLLREKGLYAELFNLQSKTGKVNL